MGLYLSINIHPVMGGLVLSLCISFVAKNKLRLLVAVSIDANTLLEHHWSCLRRFPTMYKPLNFCGGRKATSVYGKPVLQMAKNSRSHIVKICIFLFGLSFPQLMELLQPMMSPDSRSCQFLELCPLHLFNKEAITVVFQMKSKALSILSRGLDLLL